MPKRAQEYIQSDITSQNSLLAALREKEAKDKSLWESQQNAEFPTGPWVNPDQAKLDAVSKQISDLNYERQGLGPDGTPLRPEFESLLDPATGLMKDTYQMRPELLDPTKLVGLQELQKRVTQKGPSAWADLMLQRQKHEEMGAKDAAARQALSSASQARGQLAMRGGMSSGARERLAMQGGRGLLQARQQVGSQGIGNRLGIMTEDESQKMRLLPQFAEAEGRIAESTLASKNKASEWNILRALEEKKLKDVQDMDIYKEQLKKWGTEREAQATERSRGGGGK